MQISQILESAKKVECRTVGASKKGFSNSGRIQRHSYQQFELEQLMPGIKIVFIFFKHSLGSATGSVVSNTI